MGKTCQCQFCKDTYPAIKRLREYMRPEDWTAIDNALAEAECRELERATQSELNALRDEIIELNEKLNEKNARIEKLLLDGEENIEWKTK